MKDLIRKLGIFLILNIFILGAILFHVHGKKEVGKCETLNNWESEGVLRVLPQGKRFDVLMLGASNGRCLSRGDNHKLLEMETGKNILNLSLGDLGGILPAKIALELFLKKGNYSKNLAVMLFHPAFFNYERNFHHNFVSKEPYDLDLLWLLVKNFYSTNKISKYLGANLSNEICRNRNFYRMHKDFYRNKVLDKIDHDEIQKKWREKYFKEFSLSSYRKIFKELESLIDIALEHQMKIKLIITPVVIGNLRFPEEDLWLKDLQEVASKYEEVELFNHRNIFENINYFTDHYHLNMRGVESYSSNYLKYLFND